MNNPAVTVSGYDMDNVGEQDVTVSYKDITATYPITVNESPITSINIKKEPSPAINGNKVNNFIQDQVFDVMRDGLLNVEHENGDIDEIEITKDMLTGYNMATVGEQDITVSYGGFQATYKINVEEKQLESIKLVDDQVEKTYIENPNGTLKLNNSTIGLLYNNGIEKPEIIALTEQMCSGYDMSEVGTQTVTVTYEGKTTSFDIDVKEKTAIELSIQDMPLDNFVVGTDFDVTGGKLLIKYDNGTTEVVDMTTDMCSGYDMNRIEKQNVTVSYKGLTVTYPITVIPKEVTQIELIEKPVAAVNGEERDTLVVDQDFDIIGGKLKATYNDGTIEEIDVTEGMCSGYDLTKSGDTEITVTYGGKTATFTLPVIEKEITDITFVQTPSKTQYKIEKDNELVLTDAVLNANYNNGKSVPVKLTKEMCSGYNLSTLGKQTITVTYEGKTTTFDIEVLDKILTKIEMLTMPNTTFVQGTTFNVDGGKVKLYYDNDTTAEKALTLDMCSGYDLETLGEQTVVVTEGQVSTSYNIVITEPVVESISIKTAPQPYEQVEGADFKADGGVLTATYNNGKTKDVNITDKMCSGYDMNRLGEQDVTVTYQGKTTKTVVFSQLLIIMEKQKTLTSPIRCVLDTI